MNAPLRSLVHSALACAVCLVAIVCGTAAPAAAQGNRGSDDRPVSQRLSGRQNSIAGRVGDLEKVLLRSSELEAAENPTRAALLRRAVQLSKQVQLANLLTDTADKLNGQQYSDAIAQQQTAKKNLAEILKLLQSENRSERVREEREQVRRWIEETDRLLRMQGALRGRTEGGQELDAAQRNQEQLEAKADEIADDLLGEEPGDSEPSDEQPSENSPADGKSGDPKSEQGKPEDSGSASKPDDGNSSDAEQNSSSESEQGESQQGESQQGESQQGESQQGESQQGESQQGESSEKQEEQPKSATEKAGERLRKAQQKMQEARQELKNAKRDGAVEKQRQAEQELRDAVADLEQILKQLREEEIERSLASLETRLRSMLDMQNQVLEETRRLNEISGVSDGPNRQVEIRASKLALEEQKVLRAGERAYNLLREEGSSAAFPEAIEQVNTDIADVAGRLSNGNVSQLTLVIEEDIVSALEEMVVSLVAVQKENRENKKDEQEGGGGGGGGGGQQGDRPLVNKLAELRLVKTLQIRINRRTDSMSKLLNSEDVKGQVTESDVLEQVRELAQRERKIQKVTLQVAGDQNP